METIITEEVISKAEERLQKYKEGKISIDQNVTQNEEWWRGRHWQQFDRKGNALEEKPASAWLFNSIINKHADIMDNYPKPNILPRTEQDEEQAHILSQIIPVMLEQNDYEQTYDEGAYDLLIDGGCITGVFWDQAANRGLGSNVISQVDVHNLFWKPGVNNIQDSPDVFLVRLEDVDNLKAQYPDKADKFSPMSSAKVVEYVHDDNIDTTNMTEIVDWYYKKTVLETKLTDEAGNPELVMPKQVLHYVKYCGNEVLYASEDDPDYAEQGYYHHGQYPFVVRRLFRIKDCLWGFGYVDVMRSPQKYIDVIDQAWLQNSMMLARPRYFVRKSANIDLEEFADWDKLFVKVSGNELGDSVKKVDVDSMPNSVVSQLQSKIDELKETSGNRDFSQGTTTAGVTAASAIASLQEAGSKTIRDMNKICYRAHQEETRLMVENIRQFMNTPQTFRIDDGQGGYDFVTYDNSKMQDSVFDIKIVAEKMSPFSRAAQNEEAKDMFSMGMFTPEAALPALTCLDMMEFEGKEKVKQDIMQNSTIMQQFQQMQATILQADAFLPGIAAQAGLVDPMQAQAQAMAQREQAEQAEAPPEKTPQERAARKESDTTLTAKARLKAANQSSIK